MIRFIYIFLIGFEPGSRVNFDPLRASLEGFDNHSEVPSTSSNGGIGKNSIYDQVYLYFPNWDLNLGPGSILILYEQAQRDLITILKVPSRSSNDGIGKDSIYNQVYNFEVCWGFGGLEGFEVSSASSNDGIGKDPIYVKVYHFCQSFTQRFRGKKEFDNLNLTFRAPQITFFNHVMFELQKYSQKYCKIGQSQLNCPDIYLSKEF